MFSFYLPHLYSKMNLPNYDLTLAPINLNQKFHTIPEKAIKLTESVEAKFYFYVILLMKLLDEK